MLTELLPNLFRIEVPLPGTPLKALNAYFLKGTDRHLLIDTGFNNPKSKEAVIGALTQLNVSPADCDFFLTHLHADHTGLVSELATDTSYIYCSKSDSEDIILFYSGNYWGLLGHLLLAHGFPEDILQKTIEQHPASRNGVSRKLYFTFVDEGDFIEIGEYKFICMLTPGHTPGHVCLYEPNKKILISGDHILGNITPNITVWPKMQDALSQYLENLAKIEKLELDLILPGHRGVITEGKKRINEIKLHHEKRLAETLEALNNGPLTAYQVASYLTWDLSYKSFEEFPFPQKWFATGETAAHLEYLVEQEAVKKEISNGKYLFSLI